MPPRLGALSLEAKVVAAAGLVLLSMLLTRKYLGGSRLPGVGKPFFRLQESYALVQRARGSFVPKTSKPVVVKSVAAIAVTAALSVTGFLNAAQPPTVRSVAIPVPSLPPSLNKLKLVLLSDVHLGPTVGKTKMAMLVRMVNALKPDIIVIVGDLTDSEVSTLKTATEPLRELNSELGTYFVTGNHEYYTSDVDNWFKLLESMNIHPLHNENMKITGLRNSQDWLCLAGVDDIEANALGHAGHGMDLEKALNGCSQDHPIVLLAHQPLAAKWALQSRPDIDLILSGHTHGGQIFPLTIFAYLFNPFFSGLYEVGQKTFVYVSPGTVYYGIPMRLLSRAEITEIVLQSH
ncbi:transmembrane protein with metallophosphoesterase domain isoform X2 [Rhinatrema bivittatum]|uniref:transmembrane protein with metallophosphoesterase domain isoform X2 n=1 Tax=Rhinatrema bivittatum TaxID=194408 RepID=UPI00112CC354|nr:transmembrane protein with metallophosphoesterase domain isoform X2 [Rhinatrema bivittatum]